MNISKRLKQIGDYVPIASVVLDIGTDHAQLPEYLVRERQAKHVIAGEVNYGPYQRARMHINNQRLAEHISVRQGDGFAVLQKTDPQIDVVTIAGMGGSLICDLLTAAPYRTKLVLQPMGAEYKLRTWLQQNNYCIIDEQILEESNIYYEIINAIPVELGVEDFCGRSQLSEVQLKFGPKLLQEKNEIFIKKWQEESKKLLKQVNLIASRGKTTKAQQNKDEIEKNIAEINEVINSD